MLAAKAAASSSSCPSLSPLLYRVCIRPAAPAVAARAAFHLEVRLTLAKIPALLSQLLLAFPATLLVLLVPSQLCRLVCTLPTGGGGSGDAAAAAATLATAAFADALSGSGSTRASMSPSCACTPDLSSSRTSRSCPWPTVARTTYPFHFAGQRNPPADSADWRCWRSIKKLGACWPPFAVCWAARRLVSHFHEFQPSSSSDSSSITCSPLPLAAALSSLAVAAGRADPHTEHAER